MTKVVLKNGIESDIQIWNFNQLKEFSESGFPVSKKENYHPEIFQGFTYFGPVTSRRLANLNNLIYSEEKNISPLEMQEDRTLKNEDYHRSLVASVANKPVGLIVCQWIKDNLEFWRYHIRFIDVREDFQNLGIASALIKELDNSSFLKGKILQRGLASLEGLKYAEKVFERELESKDYALIPQDYYLIKAPEFLGKLDNRGRIRN